MKSRRAALVFRPRARALAAAAFALLAAASAGARQGPPSIPRRDAAAERIRDEQKREMQLRRATEEAERATDERPVRAAVKQLSQDFHQIQVIRNDLARALTGGAPLDFAHVSEQAAEVRKRALRMQSYLGLRGDEKQPPPLTDLDEGSLKEALVRLCKRIDSFVANPRFTSPEVLNVEGNARAGRDLQEIIRLSSAVHEGAGRAPREDSTARHPDH